MDHHFCNLHVQFCFTLQHIPLSVSSREIRKDFINICTNPVDISQLCLHNFACNPYPLGPPSLCEVRVVSQIGEFLAKPSDFQRRKVEA